MALSPIENFRSFAQSVGLRLEFASEHADEGHVNLFSYENDGKSGWLMYLYGENQFDTAWEYDYHDFLTLGRHCLEKGDRMLVLGS